MTLSGKDIIKARHVHALITNELNTQFTLAHLATRFRINPTTLEQAFKFLYRKPVHEFTIEYKMMRALEMLQDCNLKIETIAVSLGYANKSSFAKAFRDYYGEPPSKRRGK